MPIKVSAVFLLFLFRGLYLLRCGVAVGLVCHRFELRLALLAKTLLSLRDIFFSEDRNPFVCFADISPNRGIT